MKEEIKPKVSVIIVNYNSSALINNCIESIFRLTSDINFEIVIVDNATECLSDVITYSDQSNVKLLQLSDNIGFGRANNAGVEIAEGDYLFFLNPDTLLLNNAIKILADFLDVNPACAVCGGNLFDIYGSPAFSFRRIAPGILFDINELLHHIPTKLIYGENQIFNYSDKPMNVFYISGADLMIRKNIFKDLGGFSSEFFMYYEETDLCKRIHNLKMCVCSVPEARIMHIESGCFDNRINDRRIKMIEHGRIIFYNRNLSYCQREVANALYKLFLRSRICFVRHPLKKEHYRRRLEYFNILLRK